LVAAAWCRRASRAAYLAEAEMTLLDRLIIFAPWWATTPFGVVLVAWQPCPFAGLW
jgi:hypothetical protein